jgi:hypothetical protein
MLIQPTGSRADFGIVGVGAISCGKLAQDYQRNPTQTDNMMMTWAQGFMSAMNVSLTNGQYRDLAAMTLEAQEEDLRRYCDEHPMGVFIKGVMDLYFKLPMKKYTAPTSR